MQTIIILFIILLISFVVAYRSMRGYNNGQSVVAGIKRKQGRIIVYKDSIHHIKK